MRSGEGRLAMGARAFRAISIPILVAMCGCTSDVYERECSRDTPKGSPCDKAIDRDCDCWNDWEDCKPDDAKVHPGAREEPGDGTDNDCNPANDDDDGDGTPAAQGDCDDSDPNIGGLDAGSCKVVGKTGACAIGRWSCADGGPFCDPVEPDGGVEECNGVDDDCDTDIDEDFPKKGDGCKTGEHGDCENGTWACENGNLQCKRLVAQAPKELCTGPIRDADCDGTFNVDECQCGVVPVEPPPCFDGPPEKMNKGNCKPGVLTCVDGVFAGPCTGQVLPSMLSCDGVNQDEDCNGIDDWNDDPNVPRDCECLVGMTRPCDASLLGAQGECVYGTDVCIQGKWQCIAPKSTPEICDGKDNDCNGVTDDMEYGLFNWHIDGLPCNGEAWTPKFKVGFEACKVLAIPTVRHYAWGGPDVAFEFSEPKITPDGFWQFTLRCAGNASEHLDADMVFIGLPNDPSLVVDESMALAQSFAQETCPTIHSYGYAPFSPPNTFQSFDLVTLRKLGEPSDPTGNTDTEWSVLYDDTEVRHFVNGKDGGPNTIDATVYRIALAQQLGFKVNCDTNPNPCLVGPGVQDISIQKSGFYQVQPLFGVRWFMSAQPDPNFCPTTSVFPVCNNNPADDNHGYELEPLNGLGANDDVAHFRLTHHGKADSTMHYRLCVIGR